MPQARGSSNFLDVRPRWESPLHALFDHFDRSTNVEQAGAAPPIREAGPTSRAPHQEINMTLAQCFYYTIQLFRF